MMESMEGEELGGPCVLLRVSLQADGVLGRKEPNWLVLSVGRPPAAFLALLASAHLRCRYYVKVQASG